MGTTSAAKKRSDAYQWMVSLFPTLMILNSVNVFQNVNLRKQNRKVKSPGSDHGFEHRRYLTVWDSISPLSAN